MIRFLNYSIMEATHVETGEKMYELSHWFVSDDNLEYAGRVSAGFFKSYQEAEDNHHARIVDGLLNNEITTCRDSGISFNKKGEVVHEH